LYKAIKERPHFAKGRKEIDNKYQRAKHILDKDFHTHFPNETESRLWELEIACRILDTGCKTERLQGAKASGSPDFSIRCGDHMVHFECVCAMEGKNVNAVDAECEITEEKSETFEHIVTQFGHDKRKNARFSSVLRNKAKQVEKFCQKGIIKESDKTILAVTNSFRSGKGEFEDTIASEEIIEHSILSEGCPPELDFKDITLSDNSDKYFVKNHEKIEISDSELDRFNGFIYSNSFCDIFTSDKSCHAYERHSIGENDRQLLKTICGTEPIKFNRLVYSKDTTEEDIEERYRENHKKGVVQGKAKCIWIPSTELS
jgi:hypothetical protein